MLGLIAIAAGMLALCGAGFYVLCLLSVRSFRRSRTAQPEFAPAVSILKPLRGVDPRMYESFRSHCVQDYSEYEIIFGVNDADDPAVEAVHRLMREFPNCPIRLVICSEVLGTNRKVSNLVQMLRHARHDHILINDSDIFVTPDYLRRVMAPFGDPQVGMVTCPYRGIPADTLGSKLESLGISTDFFAGVFAAWKIEKGLRFGLGSTLAMSRTAMDAMGGLEPLVNYLADDFEMGSRIAQAGFEVVLLDLVVETHLPPYDFRGFLQHQMRWARSTRDSRRQGYIGILLTFGLPWAMIAALLAHGTGWAWLLLAFTAALRAAVALQVGAIVRDKSIRGSLWLIPLRDLIALWVWFASFAGHTVHWRGDIFILESGKIRPAQPAPEPILSASETDEPVEHNVSVHG
jgi:ceramide glucosyltransferase